MQDRGDDDDVLDLTLLENAAIMRAANLAVIEEQKNAKNVVVIQLIVLAIFASIISVIKSQAEMTVAVLVGGGVSVVNGVMIAWRMHRASLRPVYAAHHQVKLLYFYAAERNLVVLLLLCLCMILIKLSALGLLSGFVVGQVALLLSRFFSTLSYSQVNLQ